MIGSLTNRFPYMATGAVIALSPRGGTLLHSSHRQGFRISIDAARLLMEMDGQSTLDVLLSRAFHRAESQTDLLKVTADLATLYRNGLLEFGEAASLHPAEFRGSFDIYYPENLQIEITSDCNLRCSYCYRDASYGKSGNRLSTDSLLKILTSLHARGMNSVEITGGEPFTHPDFARIVEFCSEYFLLIGLLTNGTLITERSIQPLLRRKERFVVSVSLDSHRPEVHDRRRGQVGAFDRTLNGIRLLASRGFLTRVSMSVDEDNWGDLEETILLARSLGAQAFTYSPILPFGRGKKNFQFWSRSAMEVAEREQEIHEKYKGFLDLLHETTVARLQDPGSCGAGHRVYAMDPEGNVRPCVTFGTNQAIFGCLATQSPEEVFGSELSRSFANLSAPHLEVCESCKWAWFCRNCVYRGMVASEWIKQENCAWLQSCLPQTMRDAAGISATTVSDSTLAPML